MAVDTHYGLVNIGDFKKNVANKIVKLLGSSIANRIGYIDRRCPGRDNRLQNLAKEVVIAAEGVLR